MLLAVSLLIAGWLAGGMMLVLVLVLGGGFPDGRLKRVLFWACCVLWGLIVVAGVQLLHTP